MFASFQSIREVSFPTVSPKPDAIIARGAVATTSKSAITACGWVVYMVFFKPPWVIGAPFEAYPSIDGAVAIDTKGTPVR